MLQTRLTAIGEDGRCFGAHSPRFGNLTSGGENRANLISMMQRTGHTSVAMVLRYVRPAQAFLNDPLAGFL